MLPPLATIDDIRELAPDLILNETQAGRLLGLVSAQVRKEAGQTWTNDAGELEGVPDGIPELVALVVIRYLRAPDPGVTQQQVGNWSESYTQESASYGPRLLPGEKDFIHSLTESGPKAFTITTHGTPGYL